MRIALNCRVWHKLFFPNSATEKSLVALDSETLMARRCHHSERQHDHRAYVIDWNSNFKSIDFLTQTRTLYVFKCRFLIKIRWIVPWGWFNCCERRQIDVLRSSCTPSRTRSIFSPNPPLRWYSTLGVSISIADCLKFLHQITFSYRNGPPYGRRMQLMLPFINIKTGAIVYISNL